MFVTVGICTWNRAPQLDACLSAMRRLENVSELRWELLVVDNGSTDETAEVVQRHAPDLPLTALFEPNAGKSYALNHALRHARGDYVLWTDDDVLVSPQWLSAYAAAFRRWPNASLFGGPIEASFAAPAPAWLRRALPEISAAYAIRHVDGNAESPIHRDYVPFGANLAMSMKAQRSHPYDVRLGRSRHHAVNGEETSIVRRLLALGAEGRWVPDAHVTHVIGPRRLTTAYLRHYYRGAGDRLARFDSLGFDQARPPALASTLARALHAELAYRVERRVASPERWVRRLRTASMSWGTVDAAWRARSQALHQIALPYLSEV